MSDVYGVRPQRKPENRVAAAFRYLGRSTIPALALTASLAGAWQYGDLPVVIYDHNFTDAQWYLRPSGWLTAGMLLLPLAYLALNLTGRRYGAGVAAGAAVLGSAVFAGLTFFLWANLPAAFAAHPLAHPIALTFAAAFGISLLAAVWLFDITRGSAWWTAPFFAVVGAGVLFCLIFYPAAHAGGTVPWTGRMLLHMALMAASAIVLLVPYWLCRPVIRPLPGYGGY